MPSRHGRVSFGRDATGPFVTINCQGDLDRIYISEGNLDIAKVQTTNLCKQHVRNAEPVLPICRAEVRPHHDR